MRSEYIRAPINYQKISCSLRYAIFLSSYDVSISPSFFRTRQKERKAESPRVHRMSISFRIRSTCGCFITSKLRVFVKIRSLMRPRSTLFRCRSSLSFSWKDQRTSRSKALTPGAEAVNTLNIVYDNNVQWHRTSHFGR